MPTMALLDFTGDPIQTVMLEEQLAHKGWSHGELYKQTIHLTDSSQSIQLVEQLAQVLPHRHADDVLFNLPKSSLLTAQIVVAGAAMLEELPRCIHMLYPLGDRIGDKAGRDASQPYRLVGMLPLDVAKRLGEQAVGNVAPSASGRWVVNLSDTPAPHLPGMDGELQLPLHEHSSVAAQINERVFSLSLTQWKTAIIVLPRLSSLAALAISFISGLIGSWPTVVNTTERGKYRMIELEAINKQAMAAVGIDEVERQPMVGMAWATS